MSYRLLLAIVGLDRTRRVSPKGLHGAFWDSPAGSALCRARILRDYQMYTALWIALQS